MSFPLRPTPRRPDPLGGLGTLFASLAVLLVVLLVAVALGVAAYAALTAALPKLG